MVLKDTGQCEVVGQESSATELATAVALYQPDVGSGYILTDRTPFCVVIVEV